MADLYSTSNSLPVFASGFEGKQDMKKQIRQHGITVAVVLGLLTVGAGAFVYSGIYNIGADDHHTKPVFAVLQALRDRSIQRRSEDIVVPNLEDPQLILKGAGQYAAMCTGCHLKPGMKDSEIRPGLYPQPPNLSRLQVDPREAFWVIKHGIKMSAMPAWGGSHDDATIWSMVAFLQKLPAMTPSQYKDIVARAPADDDMQMEGEAGPSHEHEHAAGVSNGSPAPESPLNLTGLTPGAVPRAEAVAQALGEALQRGDRDAVLALLAAEVTASESGHVESRESYAAGHLGADIEFMKGASLTPIFIGSGMQGEFAVVGRESDIHTSVDGRPESLRSVERLRLRRVGASWKIVAIEWQSRRLPSP